MSIDYEGGFDFAGLEARILKALPDALKAGGDYIGERADARAPVLVDVKRANKQRREQVGDLVRSRFVRPEGNDVAIGYSVYWAGFQHEDLEYHHDIGEAKWLERTFAADGDDGLGKVAEKLREAL